MSTAPSGSSTAIRRRIRLRGVVQGVGMRPYVHRAADALGLAGSVRNDSRGVLIDVQGPAAGIERLLGQLRAAPPPRARIDAIESEACEPRSAPGSFIVEASEPGATATAIGADGATCQECLAELFDPQDRRWRYPFINCTHCGPRYTIVRELPYDRAATSLAPFRLCADCAREYGDPANRRFHAEPNACAACGPTVWLETAHADHAGGDAGRVRGDAAIGAAVAALGDGRIVAMRSVGGFHLVCDARNAAAVAELRRRKQRDAQPLALMALNPASLEGLVQVDDAARAALVSSAAPIVLLPKSTGAAALGHIADGLADLGVMLPYTPLHWLLFHEAAGRPAGTDWLAQPHPLLLVMTSANAHGEPIVTDNASARERLAGIADAWLMHARDILTRCDDSIVAAGAHPVVVRRSRGFAPDAIRLARPGPPVLALGAHFKNTICLTRGDEAFVSQHLGDLDEAEARRAFDAAVRHFRALIDVTPVIVAHDLHPDMHASQRAAGLAQQFGAVVQAVQHHHAHAAAVLAEHRRERPTLALTLDGVGYGTDGGWWGGELLHVDGARCDRLGSLATLSLPGVERAAREPWRCAAAALSRMGRLHEVGARFADQPAAAGVVQMLDRAVRCAPSSALGRWFDAAAALLGVRTCADYEAQAAMEFEALALRAGEWERHLAVAREQRCAITVGADGRLDLLPLLSELLDAPDPPHAALRFHARLVVALADWVRAAAAARGLDAVVLAGGCLLNRLLRAGLVDELARGGIHPLLPRGLPPGDGAISLGQAWVAHRALEGN